MRKFKEIISVALIFTLLFTVSTFSPYAADDKNEVFLLRRHQPDDAAGRDGHRAVRLPRGNIKAAISAAKWDVCPAKDGGLKVNDIIKKVNNTKISTNEELKSEIEKSNGNEITVEIDRNGKTENKTVLPIKNTVGVYLLGAWVRDSCAGIGTMTYYDDSHNYFAALGHGICDCDTAALLPLKSGEAVRAEISGIEKSVCGKAGSFCGYFTDVKFGNLSVNSPLGIFGDLTSENYKRNKKYLIANDDEVKTGKAVMVTTPVGDTPPIVQNGKIIGAVTHVFLNNPKEGYGVFAQYMANRYNNQH